jgi:PAS domain S-box-containing protein
MPDLIFLITQKPDFNLPTTWYGWLGWLAFLSLVILLNLRLKEFNQSLSEVHRRRLILFIISVPVSVLLLPSVNLGVLGFDSSFPIFGAISWFLAAGIFGPAISASLAFFTGILISIFGGNNIFFPLEIAFLATLLGWLFFQEYRTPFFRALRHPMLAAIPIILSYPFLNITGAFILGQGSLSIRLLYGLRNLLGSTFAFGIMVFAAGLLTEGFIIYRKSRWGAQKSNLPSPAESKLSTRFLLGVVPLLIVLLLIFMGSTWFISGRAARQMLEGRMSAAAEITAQSIPFFLETGQNLLLHLANNPLYETSTAEIQSQLATQRRETPYFSQLIYLSPDGETIASDPADALSSMPLSMDEINQIGTAAMMPIYILSIAPEAGSTAAYLSFIAGVTDPNSELRGILVGRSDLAENPFAKPMMTSIGSLSGLNGEGMLVDDRGFILYSDDPAQVMSQYEGSQSTTAQFFDQYSPDGGRTLVYFYPVQGKSWRVIVTVPYHFIQDQAINIALPLLGMIIFLVIIAIIVIRYILNSITSSLGELAVQAKQISHGDLDQSLELGGVDEVGQLKIAFEQMRKSLKARLDEQNRLLFVSQGIASTFEIEESLKRVLDSSLIIGASSARIYLLPTTIPTSTSGPSSAFTIGTSTGERNYAFLDEQVSMLTEKQEILKLNNLTRPKIFSFADHQIPPQAILSIALRHENHLFGNLWIAFDDPHQFTNEEVGYISTLAGQAALAVANARLFLSTEIDRHRLESVLNSTPDPVFVIDQSDNLILLNPAAEERFNLFDESEIGKPISTLISNEEILTLFDSDDSKQHSKEVVFSNGQTYLATVSSVEVEDIGAGKVCILRDVTTFKQLNSSKSDFVSTVSHDLRSPLALIQGYTSMLQMLGDLNEQQSSFLNKISEETEKISHLVTNLLDLGRIEAGVGLQLDTKPVDDVVERVIAAAQVQADQKRVNLIPKFEQANLPSIQADQALLQQALFNLVDNAIKFTDPGGEVAIGLRLKGDRVEYSVEDSGIGISPADQQNLFEKFFRVSGQQDLDEGGSGLGLAIVKSIAEKHSGVLHVESQLGVGSKFFLELPLRQSQD